MHEARGIDVRELRSSKSLEYFDDVGMVRDRRIKDS
jgi:hypothetical protein